MGRPWLAAHALAGLIFVSCRAAPVEGPSSERPTETVAVAETPNGMFVVGADDRGSIEPAAFRPSEEPAIEPVVEPPPEPIPFEGRDAVRLEELVVELDRIADEMAELPAVRADYDALVVAKGLQDTEALYRDYVRVKLAFETTRDGGLWHLSWDITNKKPNSEQIWKQWKRADAGQDDAPVPTAIAECDELSALFAFFARKLEVRHVGLFWPVWNHVVAVWTVQSEDGTPVRIVVPTSQIYLGFDDSLGTDGFDPWTQKSIFEYRRRDVKDSHRIDGDLARFFVVQAQRHGGRSQAELQRLRNARDLAMSASES